MTTDIAHASERDVRGFAGPVAFAGSLAILLSAAPASAVTPASGDAAHVASPTGQLPRLVALPRVANAAPDTYTVAAGDTVSTIAARFGLRTADVLALNGLSWSSSVIYPGQSLRLTGASSPAPPAASTPAPSTTIQTGDTVSAIAARHGVSTQALLDANGLTWSSIIYPGQALNLPGNASQTPPTPPAPAPAPPAGASYTVQSGDTISAIAQRHGASTQAVLDANGLTRDAVIYPGQSIALPGAMTLASAPAPAPSVSGLDAEQVANARIIIEVGRELGVPDRGIAIALGTAMQESWIRNLDWGDRDSLGLFQQRPSTGWGSAEQIRDPHRSTRVFYGGPGDPNGSATRGLLDIPGWDAMSYAQAAQAVQISAYPDRYAQWEEPAYAWLSALG
ncbi:LysM peptidoglycan-binding domain-containing protein [Microbacterium sp. SLBN-146]|uniref:lytic transglycosylase n=1 Tax=Microbacterium sp. SLBN-146 TaxID=2768457 RepID=UPI0011725177|nr:LysM peptidoglycan-binding domain-containing protein [Microbacterium sp. SLBN-146]TQJ32378.1 LysM repeat protein [Microbacterium sp. SLBN-146]